MASFLFRSRWVTLAWAAGLLFAIAALMSSGGGVDKLKDTAEEIRAKRAEMEKPVRNAPVEISTQAARTEEVPISEDDIGPSDELRSRSDDRQPSDSYVVVDHGARVQEATSASELKWSPGDTVVDE